MFSVIAKEYSLRRCGRFMLRVACGNMGLAKAGLWLWCAIRMATG